MKAAHSWIEPGEVDRPPSFDAVHVANLCLRLRVTDDEESRLLARGALVSAIDTAGHARAEALFHIRYALDGDVGGTELPRGFLVPKLDPKDEAAALEMFARLSRSSNYTDDELIAESRRLRNANRRLWAGGLFARFSADLAFLATVLKADKATSSAKAHARGALAYLLEEQDVIPDDLGVVGLLDDAFVARTAVGAIDPGRLQSGEAIDALVAQLPFLTELSFGGIESAYGVSEYVLANASVLAWKETIARRSAISVPHVGALPFLIGLIEALSAVYRHVTSAGREPTYERGDTLMKVDDSAVVHFCGYLSFEGGTRRDCTRAEATHFEFEYPPKGKRSQSVRHVAKIKELQWFRKSHNKDKLKSASVALGAEKTSLGGLERLFRLTQPARLSDMTQHIVVVAPVAKSHELAQRLELASVPLVELLPFGRVIHDSDRTEYNWWSDCRGMSVPLITIAKDSTEAARLARNPAAAVTQVVLDCQSGRVDEASLAELVTSGTPTLAIVPESATELQDFLEARSFVFWDWYKERAEELVWPQHEEKGPLSRLDRTSQSKLLAHVETIALDFQPVKETFASLKDVERLQRTQHEDCPPGFEEFMAQATNLFFVLLGTVSDLLPARRARAPIDSALQAVERQIATSKDWWGQQLHEAAAKSSAALCGFLRALEERNPKREALEDILARETQARVLFRPAGWEALADEFGLDANRRIGRAELRAQFSEVPVVIYHWPGRDAVRRLTLPPCASRIMFLQYDWEHQLFADIVRQRRRRVRSHYETRHARLATTLYQSWGPPPPATTDLPGLPAGGAELAERFIGAARREAAIRGAALEGGDERVDALLVFTVGGGHVFLGMEQSINTVTHLVDEAAEGEPDLATRVAHDLRAGDVVLMANRADRDLLSALAEERVGSELCATARLWQKALRAYRSRFPSDAAMLRKLRDSGVQRTDATMRGWLRDDAVIGPRDDDVIDIIARVTSDSELTQFVDDVRDAISTLRGEHIRLSKEIAKKAISELKRRLVEGTEIEEVVELDSRYTLLWIEAIDETIHAVPRTLLNRYREPDND